MSQELVPATLPLFLDRFQNFYDGLIRQLQVDFMRFARTHATVVISVQDKEGVVDEGWVNVTLDLEDITKVNLLEGNKTTCVVLSYGLEIAFLNENIYLSFCPNVVGPKNMDEFEDSDFLIVGKKCTWFTSPYTEA